MSDKRTLASLAEWWDPQHPDYQFVFELRISRLKWLRTNTDKLAALKKFYSGDPVQFIEDWCCTFDPRNPEVGMPASMPFILFPKQAEYIDWLVERRSRRQDGLVEKSRDMGISWLSCAFAVWLWIFHPGSVIGFGSRKEDFVDKTGDPDSLFWKLRFLIETLPQEFRPDGYDTAKHSQHMLLENPENGNVIKGEAGKNIGRGGRASIYFKDESAFYEQPELIEASLSQTSNVKIDISTPNGEGNPFHKKRFGGRLPVFVFDWRDDPRKDKAWYEDQKGKLDPVVLAQEVDRDYGASVPNAFISGVKVSEAMERGPADVQPIGGLRVGVDVARFGNDRTVITFRRGRVLLRQRIEKKLDTMAVAALVKREIDAFKEKPEQIAVDVIGIGAGVADRLRAWYPEATVDVNAALRLDNGNQYNLRAFMYEEMRDWLETASLPNDQDLRTDLMSIRYFYRGGLLMLMSKEDMKKEGLRSPDMADSLALTFAIPVNTVTQQAPVEEQGVLDELVGY